MVPQLLKGTERRANGTELRVFALPPTWDRWGRRGIKARDPLASLQASEKVTLQDGKLAQNLLFHPLWVGERERLKEKEDKNLCREGGEGGGIIRLRKKCPAHGKNKQGGPDPNKTISEKWRTVG